MNKLSRINKLIWGNVAVWALHVIILNFNPVLALFVLVPGIILVIGLSALDSGVA